MKTREELEKDIVECRGEFNSRDALFAILLLDIRDILIKILDK